MKRIIMVRTFYYLLFFPVFILVLPEILKANQQTKKPLSIEDFLNIHWITQPALSPDGKLVVFTSTIKNYSDNSIRSNLYVDSVFEVKNAKRFTLSDKRDYSPSFSPDGQYIGFISTRSGTPQIWVIPSSGGEAKKITDFPTGIGAFNWSPDGKKIAFVADVWIECGSDVKCLKRKAEEVDKGGGWIYSRLPLRVWNSWKFGARSHLFIVDSTGKGEFKDLTPFDHDVPPVDLGSDHDFVWSPDGKKIAFVMNETGEVMWNTNNDVYLVSVDGGSPVKVSESQGCDSAPYFSPDGRYLAFLSMERPGFESDRKVIVLHEISSGKNIKLTASLDKTVEDFVWAPDSKTIYFITPENGRRSIYSIDISGKKITKIYDKGHTSMIMAIPDGKGLVILNESSVSPPDLYRIDMNKGRAVLPPVRITFFNRQIMENVLLGTLEEFWFEGALGDKVHGFLMTPPGFDSSKKYPAIFLLHGGPQGDWDDSFHPRWNTQMMASKGHVLVMINFHGSVGYGQKFTDSISKHWGDYPLEDIMKGLDYVVKNFSFIDPDRIGAAGASYGGYLANWLLVNTDKFKAIFSHSGVWDLTSDYASTEELWFPEWEFGGTPWDNPELYEKFSPSRFVKNLEKFKTPTLVSHGVNDFRVAFEQGLQLFTILQRLGIESKFMVFPDEDHFIKKPQNVKLFYETFLNWFSEKL